MESKEKCEYIIQQFNGHTLPGSKDALLVKFADGGNKKKTYKNQEGKMWREEGMAAAVGYDPSAMVTNGVTGQHMMPAALTNYRHFSQVTS